MQAQARAEQLMLEKRMTEHVLIVSGITSTCVHVDNRLHRQERKGVSKDLPAQNGLHGQVRGNWEPAKSRGTKCDCGIGAAPPETPPGGPTTTVLLAPATPTRPSILKLHHRDDFVPGTPCYNQGLAG